jgi:hypothetical protein
MLSQLAELPLREPQRFYGLAPAVFSQQHLRPHDAWTGSRYTRPPRTARTAA